jgi:hypothetical protein
VADIISDGNVRVYWVSAIANTSAPTVAELNAGIALQSTMTPDGLVGFQPKTNDVPNRKLDSTFNTVDVGTVMVSDVALRFYKQTATDTIYNTLTKGTAGFIVIRRSLSSGTAWASSQAVQVWPAKCGETAWLDPEQDTEERYEIPIKITTQPVIRASVA